MTRIQRQIEELRKADIVVQVSDAAGRPCSGVSVWAEQETHAFVFGCVAPDLAALSDPDRELCTARLNEVFNCIKTAGQPPDSEAARIDVPDAVRLGQFRLDLDKFLSASVPLDIYVRGRSIGLDSDEQVAAERTASLYTLGFGHPAVRGIFWNGFWDGQPGCAGEGLLRLDFAPRRAFRFLHKLIGGNWHTRASGQTDLQGQFRFRGFRGDYRFAARTGEETATIALLSCRSGEKASLFTLRIPTGVKAESG